jgi:hypothetical protein
MTTIEFVLVMLACLLVGFGVIWATSRGGDPMT